MNQYERHAANGVSTTPRLAEVSANGTRASLESANLHLPWETLFPLFARPEPIRPSPPCHPTFLDKQPSVSPVPGDPFRQMAQRILSRDPPELDPLPFVEPIDLFDDALDGVQTDAVARCVQGADLLLIQGLPGTGKTRAIVELVRQMSARNQRVLLTAPTAAAIDAILCRLQATAAIEMIRCLGNHETPDQLHPQLARCTPIVRETSFRHEVVAAARDHEADLDCRIQNLRELAPVWGDLLEMAQRRECLERDRSILSDRRAAIDDDVRREATLLSDAAASDPHIAAIQRQGRACVEWTADWKAHNVELQKERARLEEEHKLACARRDLLHTRQETARSGRFWSLQFWKARFDKSLAVRAVEAEKGTAECEQAVRQIRDRDDQHRLSRSEAEASHVAERERLIAVAVESRRKEIDERIRAIDAEITTLQEGAARQIRLLSGEIQPPHDRSVESIQKAEAKYIDTVRRTDEALALARNWRTFVEAEGELIVSRWRHSVPLVAAPTNALGVDTWFARETAPYDLAIMVDAHQLSENEIAQAARRAKRWILIGEPPLPVLSRTSHRRAARPPAARRAKPATDFFARLWNGLYQEIWHRDADRLRCRLHRVPAAERDRLECEGVADRPEVELRIWNRRNAEPILAEVHFPSTMSVGEAKEYLFRELGEIPCTSRFRTGRWESNADGLVFRLGSATTAILPPRCIALSEGISLRLHERHDLSEIVVAFSGACGWTQAKAEAWVRSHLPARDAGRACRFEQTHRHAPELAAWLDDAVFGESFEADGPLSSNGAVEFVPVPRRTPAHGRHRGGAGIEIDLADATQRAQLSPELAAILPRHGYVNPAEARAIAELLPRLPRSHRVAVAAPYRAQTELLRHFCRGAFVAPVEHLAHAECDLLVISLTRSHVARAVTYGDDPLDMLCLLARARCRILFVGDPGTLARRAQWEGAIDHFDETEGERERRWVRALLPHLASRARQPHARIPQGVQA